MTGTPWDTFDPYRDPEPLALELYYIAQMTGLDPEALDWHVEAIHGWEKHDQGYRKALVEAAGCLVNNTGCGEAEA